MPQEFTCEGDDVSPPLSWTGAPSATKSFVLLIEDPDAPDPAAPKRVWLHWLLYNLPPTCTGLARGVQTLPTGTLSGHTDSGTVTYGGPCPPIGRHRYFHRLYALDVMLPDLRTPSRAAVEKAMQGHVIAQAELMGTYARAQNNR